MPRYHKFLTNSVFSLNLRLCWYSQKVICLIFSQGNQAGDGRGAQYSYAESSFPQSSFVSSTSSKPSFRPSSSSASGGVFGSSARNDRTSALKAAFQVFFMNFFFFYRSPFFLNMSVSKFVISSHTIIYSRKRCHFGAYVVTILTHSSHSFPFLQRIKYPTCFLRTA